MNKWKRRARKWRKAFQRLRRRAKSWVDHGDKCEREAQECRAQLRTKEAKIAEMREQLGEMEKHSWGWYESYLEATKQGNEAIRELTDQREALLAWQRGAREALLNYVRDPEAASALYNLRRAIEGEAKSVKFDFPAYLAQVEKWGKAYEGEAGKEET